MSLCLCSTVSVHVTARSPLHSWSKFASLVRHRHSTCPPVDSKVLHWGDRVSKYQCYAACAFYFPERSRTSG